MREIIFFTSKDLRSLECVQVKYCDVEIKLVSNSHMISNIYFYVGDFKAF